MSPNSDWPEFGPEDAEGFRTFSLYTDTHEHIRISVSLSTIQEYTNRTAVDFTQYSPREQESLKAAAALLAAKFPGKLSPDDMSRAEAVNMALTNLLESAAKFTTLAFEKWFPGLATIALQVASDACVKKTLNNVAESFKVPPVTTEKSVELLLGDLNGAIKMFLGKKGRRRETAKLLQDMQAAIKRLKLQPGEQPTQEQVAESMGVDSRALRKNMTAHGVKTWNELLLACEYWEELNTT
jgi:hypothetical protein